MCFKKPVRPSVRPSVRPKKHHRLEQNTTQHCTTIHHTTLDYTTAQSLADTQPLADEQGQYIKMCFKETRPSVRPTVRPSDRPSVRPTDRPVPCTYVGERCLRHSFAEGFFVD